MKLRRNKKGFELAINFLVVIILAIVMFGLSIMLLSKILKVSTDLSTKSQDDLDKAVGFLACKTSDQVCLSKNRLTIDRSEFQIVGLRMVNVLDKTMTIYMKTSQSVKPTGADDLNILPKNIKGLDLTAGESVTKGIGIEVPDAALSGTYVVDVEVKQCTPGGAALRVKTCNNPPATYAPYGNNKYKITVTVP